MLIIPFYAVLWVFKGINFKINTSLSVI